MSDIPVLDGWIFNRSGNTEDFCIYVCAKEGMSLRESLRLFAANSGVEKRHGGGRDAEKSVCRDDLSWEKCTFASIKPLNIIRKEQNLSL